jgi:hypothetical protein
LEKGSLHRKHEPLAADKSKRSTDIVPKGTQDPGPGTYSPTHENSLTNIKKPTKKEAFKGSIFINNLKSTGLNLTTVPSIPSKS